MVVGHPFDTLKVCSPVDVLFGTDNDIKVRLQVSGARFDNSVRKCLAQTISKEGVRGLYKGGTPPLFGWAIMDSVMLGSLSNYRRYLSNEQGELTLPQHALAGLGAGLTVAMVATPIEHVKARLQVQYDAKSRIYSGPFDATVQLVKSRDLYKGLTATLIQRSWFGAFWASYAVISGQLNKLPSMSDGAKSFWAGGFAASA